MYNSSHKRLTFFTLYLDSHSLSEILKTIPKLIIFSKLINIKKISCLAWASSCDHLTNDPICKLIIIYTSSTLLQKQLSQKSITEIQLGVFWRIVMYLCMQPLSRWAMWFTQTELLWTVYIYMYYIYISTYIYVHLWYTYLSVSINIGRRGPSYNIY